MKYLYTIALFTLSSLLFSQAPNLINYQGVTRDAGGIPVSGNFTLTLEIRNAGLVYSENHAISTNSLGLFNVKIGGGNQIGPATFASIDWATGPYNLSVSLFDGTNNVAMGTQQMVSVPYALYAKTAGSSSSQSLQINGNTLSITGGNSVNLPSGATYTGGTNVNVTGAFPNYTIDATPTLSLSGSVLSISGGNSVPLPTGTTYTNGNGISLVSGTIITNTAPNQTVNVSGPNVLGAYPNYTITGSANTTVTAGNSNITVSGVTPNYTISSTPTLAINANSISISNGNTIMLPPPINPTITGSGVAVVSPTTGNLFNVSVQTPTFTSAGAASITGVYPNYTVLTASMTPGWSILGNAGTNTFTNFIGTTDGSDLSFRVNNQKAGRIENASQSVYLGYLAGPNTNTATANTGIGYNALNANTSGFGNTGIGYLALQVNNSGIWNTAIGGAAQLGNTSGSSNVALGYQALRNNSIGSGNVAIGRDAMGQNTDATGNNVAIGAFAMNSSTVGTGNVILGSNAGFQNISGSYNTATGYQSLFSNLSSSLTANGYQSLYANTTGIENTATGFKSMFANTVGDRNSAFGALALDANTGGSRNSSFGYLSLSANTIGNQNSAFGSSALRDNTNGINNSAFGIQALMLNNTGTGNSAFGGEALTAYIGNNSTAMGWHALFNSTSGAANTVLGAETGLNNTTGTGNVFLGFRAGYNEAGSNKLYIANSNVNPPLIYGDFALGLVGIKTATPSEMLELGSYSSAQNNYLSIRTAGSNNYRAGIKLSHFNNTDGFTIESNEQINRMDIIRHAVSSSTVMSFDRLNTRVGIGTTAPTQMLHVNGTVRITDGTEGNNKVLSSDAAGNASWKQMEVGFKVEALALQTVGSGSYATVAFDNVVFDDATAFNLATESYVVPSTGLYSFSSSVYWPSYSGTRPVVQILVNGALAQNSFIYCSPGSQLVQQVSTLVKVNTGDLITTRVYNDGATPTNMSNVSGNQGTLFTGFKIY